jgi:hypothetical protein
MQWIVGACGRRYGYTADLDGLNGLILEVFLTDVGDQIAEPVDVQDQARNPIDGPANRGQGYLHNGIDRVSQGRDIPAGGQVRRYRGENISAVERVAHHWQPVARVR